MKYSLFAFCLMTFAALAASTTCVAADLTATPRSVPPGNAPIFDFTLTGVASATAVDLKVEKQTGIDGAGHFVYGQAYYYQMVATYETVPPLHMTTMFVGFRYALQFPTGTSGLWRISAVDQTTNPDTVFDTLFIEIP